MNLVLSEQKENSSNTVIAEIAKRYNIEIFKVVDEKYDISLNYGDADIHISWNKRKSDIFLRYIAVNPPLTEEKTGKILETAVNESKILTRLKRTITGNKKELSL